MSIIANTFKNLPLAEREKKESFSPQVVKFLRNFPILMMSGWDLYRIVADILQGKKSAGYFIEKLYSEVGIFVFNK